jgi:peptidoglycan/xylan/chitin deacetylase (PgdA/CDA1 family)
LFEAARSLRASGLLGVLLYATGAPFVVRRLVQRRGVTILVYHDPSPDVLARHLSALRRRYRVIALREFADALDRGELASLPRRALVLTFDDGHRRNALLEPVLGRFDVPATIFVCTGIVGTARGFWFRHAGGEAAALLELDDDTRLARLAAIGFEELAEVDERDALSWDEVERLRSRFDFQAHTVTHPVLPRCRAEKAERELREAKATLQARLGGEVFAIAYPNGLYSDRDCELAARAGYRLGLTADPGFNRGAIDRFRVQRIVVGDGDHTAVLLSKAAGVWPLLKQLVRARPYGSTAPVDGGGR